MVLTIYIFRTKTIQGIKMKKKLYNFICIVIQKSFPHPYKPIKN